MFIINYLILMLKDEKEERKQSVKENFEIYDFIYFNICILMSTNIWKYYFYIIL